MSDQSIFFVGTPSEVGHHAAPLQKRRKVRIVSSEEILQTANPGDLAVFTTEHFDRFRNACVELKQRNVATLYLVDGILEWRNAWENCRHEPACPWTMRPVLSHKVASIGESQARVLTQWGNGAKVEVVGVPRFDGLKPAENLASKTNPISPAAFRILVMTAKWPGFTEKQVENAARALTDLKDWIAANPTTASGRPIEAVWRLTQGMHDRVGVQNRLDDLTGAELADVLKEVDAVITTPSTAMLEAMLHDLPVAVLEYNNSPQYVSAAWQITSADHIPQVVPQLSDPAAEKMLFQRSILQDALICDDNATRRLEILIDRMLEIASKKLDAGENLSFPEAILTPADVDDSANSVRLAHKTAYSQVSEFKQDNILELQAQLAHSRREIKHLHGELAQLQSELDEAHRIFDQINQHPIAGPVVKARQKLMDWIERFKTRSNRNPEPRTLPVPTRIESASADPLKQN